MRWLLLMALVVVVVFSGCTTVQKGAAVGGVAGAAVGGTWAYHGGCLSTAEGALVGTATGGLVGALVGDQLEERKGDDLEAEIENLKRQLAAKEEALEKAGELRIGEKDQIIDGLKRLTDKQDTELASLRKQLAEKEDELARLRGITRQRERNLDELKKELDNLQVQLAQTPKGITLTMVESLLFRPGMADLTEKGKKLLDNVAALLSERFPGRELNIEGHTDNQPIKMSGWDSNWELASARALAVLHYLVDKHGFDPKRLSATSYGEFRPVASNVTEEGRLQNRRAVIVVLPTLEVVKKPLFQ